MMREDQLILRVARSLLTVSALALATTGLAAESADEVPAESGAAEAGAMDQAPMETVSPALTNQSTSGYPQEGTRPLSLFPGWTMRATRNIDPRIRPNAGLRVPLSYFPIEDGPLLYPNFSPEPPDFLGENPLNPWAVRTSVGLFGVGDDHVSSKFQEFRDVRTGMTAGIEGHYRDNNTIFNIVARQIGRQDQDITIESGVAGRYMFGVNYTEIPHNFAFDTRSLYGGFGTEALTLPDGMQVDLQNTTSNALLAPKLLGYVNSGAYTVDQSLHRQTIGADFTLVASYPIVVKASVSNESREGVRPWSGSFGFGDFVEIPWPVKYDTQEFRITGEYFRPENRWSANAGFRASSYINHVLSFTFDNPFRIVDAPGGLNCTFQCGPAKGRMSLYPSNQYEEVNGTFVMRKLPFNSAFTAYASLGFMHQDEELLPFSTNSAAPPMRSPTNPSFNATDPAGLPRRSAQSQMDTRTVSLRWTSDPSDRIRLTGQYLHYALINQQEPFTIFQFIREDEDIRNPETVGGTYRTVPADYSRHTASLTGTYNLTEQSKVSGVYTFEQMNRDFREVERTTDNKLKVEFDTIFFGALELKSWYEHAKRSTSDYEFNQYNIVQGNPNGAPMLPWLEKFDEAPYDRDEAQAMATYAFTDAQTMSGHVQLTRTDYGVAPLGRLSMATNNVTAQATEDYQFGMRWDRRSAFGVDYTWAPSDRLSLFADLGYEQLLFETMSRQWTVNGISDPYRRQPVPASNSNWIARVRDNYYTAGLGLDGTLFTEKLKLSLQYVFGMSDSQHDYDSPIGTVGVDDVNAFDPQSFHDVDDTKTHSLNPELSYEHSKRLSVSAGYQWERWDVDDYNYKGFTYAPLYTNGVALLMGGFLPQPYRQNIIYLRVRMGL